MILPMLALSSSALALSTPGSVRLDSLDLTLMTQGWKTPQKDHGVEGGPLSIAGRHFQHGVGTHSTSAFFLDLARKAESFDGWAGIDDETNGRGSVHFAIYGDSHLLWKSPLMRGGDKAARVSVPLRGVKTVALLVDDGGDDFTFDHADWADAVITMQNGDRPRPSSPPLDEVRIAAVPRPVGPRFLGERTFGVHPRTPVFFVVAAAGKKPIRYSAVGLPKGLRLDGRTGAITGALAAPGAHTFTVEARNGAGSAACRVRLVSGVRLAWTPPMGWNSYDAWNDAVDEATVLRNAAFIHDRLLPYGWDTVVVDFRWYTPTPTGGPAPARSKLAADTFGRLLPAPNRFPSAQGDLGFKPLAARVHALGLKLGIHIMRGIPRQSVAANTAIADSPFHAADAADTHSVCPWLDDMYGVDATTPAGRAWYDSIARQYAEWGVDYVKADDMSSPYATHEIEALRKALDRSGRSIILSLSPGETPVADAAHVEEHANLWRISGDFWDDWPALRNSFELLDRWRGHGGPGAWPDADMLPLGNVRRARGLPGGPPGTATRLNRNEQVTLMTLWAMGPSPLILGSDLPCDDWTLSLLTNEEVLRVNQDPLGAQGRRIRRGNAEVWTKRLADGALAVGFFNRGEMPEEVTAGWAELGVQGQQAARDLWRRRQLGNFGGRLSVRLARHSARLIVLRPAAHPANSRAELGHAHTGPIIGGAAYGARRALPG